MCLCETRRTPQAQEDYALFAGKGQGSSRATISFPFTSLDPSLCTCLVMVRHSQRNVDGHMEQAELAHGLCLKALSEVPIQDSRAETLSSCAVCRCCRRRGRNRVRAPRCSCTGPTAAPAAGATSPTSPSCAGAHQSCRSYKFCKVLGRASLTLLRLGPQLCTDRTAVKTDPGTRFW